MNRVQLITYPDSLGGDLKGLYDTLDKHFAGLFPGGIHILPPFPATGDRGFATKTYFEIEPQFGDWDDIKKLAENGPIMLDLMVNHISKSCIYFYDFLEKGTESEYADLFLTLDKIWQDGEPVQEDIDKMFLRRVTPYSTYNGVKVWTTFGKEEPSEQVDMDIHSAVYKKLIKEIFENFAAKGVKYMRLDAIGYVIKKVGTSCFFVEPDIYEFLDEINALAKSLDMEILPEIHSHYSIQYSMAQRGFWVYDFILPYMVLEAIFDCDPTALAHYLKKRPPNQFTMLDCHDGIPIKPDLDDLVSSDRAGAVVEKCVARGANLSKIVSEKHKSVDGFDVHQIRCSYYSMLGCCDDSYILARAVQLFTPGIPQIYYVGLLAGENDNEAVKVTGEGREINRHNYTTKEIKEAVKKPVVQRLIKLVQFRNSYEVFDGTFSAKVSDNSTLIMQWDKEDKQATLTADFKTMHTTIHYLNKGEKVRLHV
ncbi:MAG: sucrose phosphorylase [Defluviitaleaceae bacterium]|nr:sucrose phosphorylase [Defluviitaleaceae bacterium]